MRLLLVHCGLHREIPRIWLLDTAPFPIKLSLALRSHYRSNDVHRQTTPCLDLLPLLDYATEEEGRKSSFHLPAHHRRKSAEDPRVRTQIWREITSCSRKAAKGSTQRTGGAYLWQERCQSCVPHPGNFCRCVACHPDPRQAHHPVSGHVRGSRDRSRRGGSAESRHPARDCRAPPILCRPVHALLPRRLLHSYHRITDTGNRIAHERENQRIPLSPRNLSAPRLRNSQRRTDSLGANDIAGPFHHEIH